MRTKKPALILYFVACFLAIFAAITGDELLLLASKPIIIPAIFFYYLSVKKGKTSLLFVLFLILTFIGDAIVLLDFRNATMYIMVPYFLSYLILLHFAIRDVRKLYFNRFGFGIALFILFLMAFLTFTLIEFFTADKKYLAIPVIIYSCALSAYVAVAGYYFYSKASTMAFYLAMSALFCAVSDVFYVMFSLIFHFPELNHFNFAVQVTSYFFIVRYFVLRKN